MVAKIQVQGLKQVNKFLIELPKKMNKEIIDESSSFLKDVRKSAKLRAPRYTGYLASSIFIKKQGSKIVVLEVIAPYAHEQETGEGLPREVPKGQLKKSGWTHEASRTKGGLKKLGGKKVARPGFFIKRSYKPFIKPALEKNLSKLAQKLSKATNRAISKARGGR